MRSSAWEHVESAALNDKGTSKVVGPELIQRILTDYELPAAGTHGVGHWARVLENGRRLAPVTGADLRVVELFAVFHDARRTNEGIDPDHGWRGGELARSLRGSFFDLNDQAFQLLFTACASHTEGFIQGDVTVQTCWDADRLDLPRVRIPVEPSLLCTRAAKELDLRMWAEKRSVARVLPDLVREEWGIVLPPAPDTGSSP